MQVVCSRAKVRPTSVAHLPSEVCKEVCKVCKRYPHLQYSISLYPHAIVLRMHQTTAVSYLAKAPRSISAMELVQSGGVYCTRA